MPCVEVFQLINDSPRAELVSGSCLNEGRDRALFTWVQGICPIQSKIAHKSEDDGRFVPWFSRPCLSYYRRHSICQSSSLLCLGMLAPHSLLQVRALLNRQVTRDRKLFSSFLLLPKSWGRFA